MTLLKLALVPSYSGYAATQNADTLQAALDGGPSRFRLNQLGAAFQVTAQWTLSQSSYEYFEAFFRLLAGSRPFLVDLILDGSDLTEYEARLIPGSKTLSGVAGLARVMQATLEVKPPVHDPATDAAIVALYASYGDTGGSVLDRLAQLVNEDPWPLED